MIRVGVIGLGAISGLHIEAIQRSDISQLVAVCDVNQVKRLAGLPFYTDYRQMITQEKLDCVHVCLPHYLHYQVTAACVALGVDVLQEKPLAVSLSEAVALTKLEKEFGEKIGICLQNRYNPTFLKMQEVIASQQYGAVKGMKGIVAWQRTLDYYLEEPWRMTAELAGGGTMINQSVHTLDWLSLIGGRLQSIQGISGKILPYAAEVEDTVVARLSFQNEVEGLFISTNGNYTNSSVEFEVGLERGTLVIKQYQLWLEENGKLTCLSEDEKITTNKAYYGSSHIRLIADFHQAISDDSQQYIHPSQAFASQKMIAIINESSTQKRAILWEEILND